MMLCVHVSEDVAAGDTDPDRRVLLMLGARAERWGSHAAAENAKPRKG
jgi:hypothetical protein